MKKSVILVIAACIVLAGATMSCKNDKEPPPAPVITGFAPVEAQHGNILFIRGENFGAENTVTINGVTAEIESATAAEIMVIVPKNMQCSGKVSVTSDGKTVESDDEFTYLLTYIVSTLAGSGVSGFADGEGASAKFFWPLDVAVDASGNVYVADDGNGRIRKITPDGVVSTRAQLSTPNGIAVDGSGNIYVTHSGCRVSKIAADGTVSALAGSPWTGFAEGAGEDARFYYPHGVAVDASGVIYVADGYNHRIRKITADGVVSTRAGTGISSFADGAVSMAHFNNPSGVAVDNASGNLYVADDRNHRIRKITADGMVSTLAGNGAKGLADGEGDAAQFHFPNGVAVDASGNVYVADELNHCIRKITADGMVSTLAGSGVEGFADGESSSAKFARPCGIAVDASGNVYVAEWGNHCIRKIMAE